jgi:hypothetical protein
MQSRRKWRLALQQQTFSQPSQQLRQISKPKMRSSHPHTFHTEGHTTMVTQTACQWVWQGLAQAGKAHMGRVMVSHSCGSLKLHHPEVTKTTGVCPTATSHMAVSMAL